MDYVGELSLTTTQSLLVSIFLHFQEHTCLTSHNCFYSTAAHCAVIGASVRRKNDILVFGGRKYRDATTNDLQELNVAKIIIHPEYNRSSLANDIAILQLSSDINTTNFVRPVSLWNEDSDENQIFGSQGTVIGFGLDEDDEESDTLQQATIPVLDMETCLAYDNETYGKHLTTKMFCAGGKDNISACNGDSGGGMFFNINDTWYLRGIVSFSPTRPNVDQALCDSSKPTVFTDATKYRKWIMRYINTAKWLKDLKPCNGTIDQDTECNAATRFDYGLLLWALTSEENVSIRRFSLNDDTAFNGREILSPKDINRLDKDCVEGRLYWTERVTQSIFSAKYDGTDKKVFITKVLDPLNFAVDWISRRLYWVDYEKETIEVASMENPDLRTTLIIDVDGNDRIAIDPLQGKLYRTVGNRGIGWSNLDGSEPELLLETRGIKDITVSIATGELCYVNENTSKIDCIDGRTKEIRPIVSNVTNTYYLAATDKIVFWSNYGRLVVL
ncbi:hypothetical protein ZHAS_00016219 [Anopheles sinensis]|uniref:Peptidase S1 domain-containing protein n=1 Tax=Anopheles sinensis TaxID=74873 RepID=A0A084WD60_ANOSI|nr:hypothetical protein ZHAS_00016219 [Anopheles sinensis]